MKSKHGTYHFDPDDRVVINLRFRLLFRSIERVVFIRFYDFFRQRPYLFIAIRSPSS